MTRKIIHIDMDAFYASVEQRDNPALRGKPVAVGGSPEKRGAVAAASYEARKFGIHSAMPSRTAYARCPQLIFVKPRFEAYKSISSQIRDIFYRYTDLVEPVAFDEAYLDVTENKLGISSAQKVAQEIRSRIFAETQLTASAGVSVNKFLAKMASGLNKPNGMAVIRPHEAEEFVAGLAIEKFHGIGKATATKLHDLGIFTGLDLRQRSLPELMQYFGKMGRFYYRIARGEDDRAVIPNRIRKSVSVENSYDPDLSDRVMIESALRQLGVELYDRLDRLDVKGYTITLKVKFADYTQITRSYTQSLVIRDQGLIWALALQLLEGLDLQPQQARWSPTDRRSSQQVRLLGLGISKLETATQPFQQLALPIE